VYFLKVGLLMGSPQLLLTESTEQGSRPGSSNKSQYQNQQQD